MCKRLIFYSALILSLAAVMMSCGEEKDEYVSPLFGKMTCQPNPAVPGEYVTITLAHQQQGNGIAGTNYRWTVKGVSIDSETSELKDTVINVHTNYDGYGKQDPVLKFRLPEDCPSGRHQVSMSATFQGYIGNHLYDKATASDYITVK